MAQKYRAGVIGRTDRGNYGHGLDRVYLEMDEVEIVAVADDDAEGLKEAGSRLAVDKLYADYRQMLAKEKFDIVSVCPRWVAPHLDMVVAAAEAGACVFLEKPIARTLAEADAMIQACDRAGVTMGIAHQGRMHAAAHHGKKLLAQGAIGEILSAQMRGKEDRRGGGEDMMVLGTHLFDTLRFMLDADPQWVFASVSLADGTAVTKDHVVDGPEEMGLIAGDRIHALYGLSNGITATFESRRNQKADGHRFALQILGSEGVMVISNASQQVRIYPAPIWHADCDVEARNVTAEAIAMDPSIQNLGSSALQMVANVAIVRDILKARAGEPPLNSGRNGRWALEMIHGVYASHLSGKRVALPLSNREHPLA